MNDERMVKKVKLNKITSLENCNQGKWSNLSIEILGEIIKFGFYKNYANLLKTCKQFKNYFHYSKSEKISKILYNTMMNEISNTRFYDHHSNESKEITELIKNKSRDHISRHFISRFERVEFLHQLDKFSSYKDKINVLLSNTELLIFDPIDQLKLFKKEWIENFDQKVLNKYFNQNNGNICESKNHCLFFKNGSYCDKNIAFTKHESMISLCENHKLYFSEGKCFALNFLSDIESNITNITNRSNIFYIENMFTENNYNPSLPLSSRISSSMLIYRNKSKIKNNIDVNPETYILNDILNYDLPFELISLISEYFKSLPITQNDRNAENNENNRNELNKQCSYSKCSKNIYISQSLKLMNIIPSPFSFVSNKVDSYYYWAENKYFCSNKCLWNFSIEKSLKHPIYNNLIAIPCINYFRLNSSHSPNVYKLEHDTNVLKGKYDISKGLIVHNCHTYDSHNCIIYFNQILFSLNHSPWCDGKNNYCYTYLPIDSFNI